MERATSASYGEEPLKVSWRPRRSQPVITMVLGIALGGALGWLAIRGIQWDVVAGTLQSVEARWLLAALLTLLMAFYLRALRWRLLLITEDVSIKRLLVVQCVGTGANNFTPVRLLSEPLQFGILTLRDGLRGGAVLATMVVGRIMDLSSNVLIIGFGLLIFPLLHPSLPYLASAVALSALAIAVLTGLGIGGTRWRRASRLPLLSAFAVAGEAMRSRPQHVASAFGLTLLYWALIGGTGWMVAQGVGITAPLAVMVIIVIAAFMFGTTLPGLPLVSGTFHFASVTLLGLLDVEREVAFSYAVLHHLVLFLPPTLFAVVVLPREGVSSLAKARQMVQQWQEHRKIIAGGDDPVSPPDHSLRLP